MDEHSVPSAPGPRTPDEIDAESAAQARESSALPPPPDPLTKIFISPQVAAEACLLPSVPVVRWAVDALYVGGTADVLHRVTALLRDGPRAYLATADDQLWIVAVADLPPDTLLRAAAFGVAASADHGRAALPPSLTPPLTPERVLDLLPRLISAIEQAGARSVVARDLLNYADGLVGLLEEMDAAPADDPEWRAGELLADRAHVPYSGAMVFGTLLQIRALIRHLPQLATAATALERRLRAAVAA